MKGMDFC